MDNFLETALTLINQYALVFYALGVIGLLFYCNRARTAYRQMRMTPFPIEREEASANVRDAVIIMVIFVAILSTTVYIDRVLLAPPDSADNGGDGIALNGDNGDSGGGQEEENGGGPSILPTTTATSPAIGPTPEQSATPTSPPENTQVPVVAPTDTPVSNVPPTETPAPPTATPIVDVAPTETQPPTPIPTQPPPTATPAPEVPSVPGAQCGTAGVRISSPGNGQAVSGNVGISGTADIPDFQFYKMEYSQGTSLGGFASIGSTVSNSVASGQLATWNTAGFPKGIYALRLTVVDLTGNFPPPCTIFVVLQ